jgi:ornithine cyclodeaminase
MGKIYSREQISKVIEKMAANDIINSIEEGFVAYSKGKVIENKALQRTSDEQITVADLTGVAVQDIQICKIVSNSLSRTSRN